MSNTFDDIVAGTVRSAPSLDPNVVTSIAQASNGNLADSIQAAQATEGMASTTKWANALSGQDAKTQASTWLSLSQQEQQMMLSAGYQPVDESGNPMGGPNPNAQQPHHSGGFLGTLGRIASDVSGVLDPIKFAAHVAGAGLRMQQHLWRSEQAITGGVVYSDQQGNPMYEAPHAASFADLNPSDWQRAWSQTSTGTNSFDPAGYRTVMQRYSPDAVQLATAKVEGRTADLLAQAKTPDAQAALQAKLDTDPEVLAAEKDLGHAQVSFGRMFVPDSLWRAHPNIANGISGSLDAIFDVTTDPAMKAGNVVKAVQATRMMAETPEAVAGLINKSAPLRRWINYVGTTLGEDNGAAKLSRAMPHLGNAVDSMTEAGVDSPEAAANWLKSNAGLVAAARGQLSALPLKSNIMPRLTVAGKLAVDARGLARQSINWAADRPATVVGFKTGELVDEAANAVEGAAPKAADGIPVMETSQAPQSLGQKVVNTLVAPVGTQLKRATTFTSRGTTLDLTNPFRNTQFRNFLGSFLPEQVADPLLQTFISGDIDTKRNVLKSSMELIADASGARQTPAGNDFWDNFIRRIEDQPHPDLPTSKYAPGNISEQTLPSQMGTSSNAIFPDQGALEWSLPSFKQVAAHAQRGWVDQQLYGYANNALSTIYMQAWKPLALLRLGFGVRVGLDELGGALARHGLQPILANIAAGQVGFGEGNPFVRAAARMAGYVHSIDPALLDDIKTPSDLVAATFGSRAADAMRKVGSVLPTGRYVDGAKLAEKYTPGAFSDEISAVEGSRGGGYLPADNATRYMKDGSVVRTMKLVGSGAYKDYGTEDALQVQMLQNEMQKMAERPAARELISKIPQGDDAVVAHMADYIQNEGSFQNIRKWMQRNTQTNDGRVVGVDATPEESAKDWAQTMLDHVKAVFQTPQGEWNQELLDKAGQGEAPTIADIRNLPVESRPTKVLGEETIGVKTSPLNAISDFINKGFEGTGRIVDWMARQGLWLHNFTTAAEEARPIFEGMYGVGPKTDEMLADAAAERAFRMTTPFIHDPQMRTQFETMYQNLIPFMFAQRQFYTRWGKTLVNSPDAFRKAQLIYGGFQNMGLIQHDANNRAYFVYPATGAMQDALVAVAKPIFGSDIEIPLQAGMTGAITMTVPGLDKGLTPSTSPFVSVPLNALATHFPEVAPIQSVAHAVLGDAGYNPNLSFNGDLIQQLVPGALGKGLSLLSDNPDNASTQLGSATVQAMQALQETGHGLNSSSTPGQVDDFIQRTKSWARVILAQRMLLGLAVPASPQLDIDPNKVHADYKRLIGTLGLEAGTKAFIKEHPDGTPWTVFATTDKGGGSYLPAYKGLEDFMANNSKFLSAYKMSASYLMPYNPIDKSFSLQAYREQVQMGLRQYKDLHTIAQELATSSDANTYWQGYDDYNKQLQVTPKGAGRTRITKQWQDISKQFKVSHPLFAEELQSSTPSQIKRSQTLDELTQALSDPKVPQGSQTDAIRTVMNTYNDWKTEDASLGGQTTYYYQQVRASQKDQLNSILQNYVNDHPEAGAVYNRLIRPLIAPGDATQ